MNFDTQIEKTSFKFDRRYIKIVSVQSTLGCAVIYIYMCLFGGHFYPKQQTNKVQSKPQGRSIYHVTWKNYEPHFVIENNHK